MVDPSQRGKGLGKEMLRLAVEYAFRITKADALNENNHLLRMSDRGIDDMEAGSNYK